MLGVIAKDNEMKAVQEFFQLFKTPWEFYREQHPYDFVIIASEEIPAKVNAKVLIIYNSGPLEIDCDSGITVQPRKRLDLVEWGGHTFPIFGNTGVLHGKGRSFIQRCGHPESVGLEISETGPQIVRIGYDLFQEVGFLLSDGQPRAYAHVPTLDIHISMLRSILVSSGNSFLEIPPVPAGYDFMASLSHDVDFTGIGQHKFDKTMWGFLYRATVGSLIDFLKARQSWSQLAQNWKAAFSLPWVYLGLMEDFWIEFDRYLEMEKGLKATYFFIPFRGCPGSLGTGPAPKHRAAKYDVLENKGEVHKLMEQGCEVGLHGIDAWRDLRKAQLESTQIRELTGQSTVGVRMHWLYFGQQSPKILDCAGFSYDSTFGYNDALGFRAGTTQVFSPLEASHLLELPLNIQDTAMFYPSRMNLSEAKALHSCRQLLETTAMMGGVVTVNWHTRSLSPERLWGDFYGSLLDELQRYRVWFGTAQEIVTWFRNRRSVRFQDVEFTEAGTRLKLTGPSSHDHPPFLVRVYHRGARFSLDSPREVAKPMYSDIPWQGDTVLDYRTPGLQVV